jgi:hypothetical protein
MTARVALATAAIAAIWITGCPRFEGSCESDADCESGEFCSAKSHSCIVHSICSPTCSAHSECFNGTCVARYSGLVITEPATDIGLGADASVSIAAQLQVAPGRTANLPASIRLDVELPDAGMQNVQLLQAGERFVGALSLGPAEGDYTLVARYPEVPLESAPRTVTVDRTPPALTVTIAPPPVRPAPDGGTTYTDSDLANVTAYRRDEQAEVTVASTSSDVTSVQASVAIGSDPALSLGSVPSVPVDQCGGPPVAWCGKITVNLWEPQMNAFRETFAVQVVGEDDVGNQATARDSDRLTRWKWVHQIASGHAIRATPAIGPAGSIVVGTALANGIDGKLVSLNHDGSKRWENPIGAVVSSPIVGRDNGGATPIYAAFRTSGGAELRTLNSADGALANPSCGPYTAGTSVAAMTLASTLVAEPASIESAVALVNGSGGILVVYRPLGDPGVRCLPAANAGGMNFPSGISSIGTRVFYGDSSGRLRGYEVGGGTPITLPGWPIGDAGVEMRALVHTGQELAGGGPGITTAPSLVSVSPDGGQIGWTIPTGGALWYPVVDSTGTLYAGRNDDRLVTATTTPTTIDAFEAGGVIQSAPLLGQGNIVYYATASGTLTARMVSALSSELWSIGGLGDVEASPNIDCARGVGGSPLAARPGVLYLATNAPRIYAFVVDSRGIDTTAPWPKYQHDPRNTGNADTPLSEFTCP